MARVGVIGLGDMGSGLAKNLMAAGYEVAGLDLSSKRMQAFIEIGGVACQSPAEVGRDSTAVFVMVMNGEQAREVILGEGLASAMAPGSAVVLTATIHAHEAREIADELNGTGIDFVDSPVSGGRPGAQGGTLTLMAAAPDAVMAAHHDVLKSVSGIIHHVGQNAGDGQTVKACLQSLMGSIFAATYEMSALAGKAGVSGEILRQVVASTAAGNGLTDGSLEHIIARRFEDTGSGIGTMHKDLTISLELAKQVGVPMQTTSAAMRIFDDGMKKYPSGDNQSAARVIEEAAGAALGS